MLYLIFLKVNIERGIKMQDTHMPLYIQIKNFIIDKIKDETFKPGDKVYSETDLKEKFNVSSTTVVKALNELVGEGYLERIQGRGSFVTSPKLKRTPLNLSITDELRGKGIDLQTNLLSIEEVIEPEISSTLKREPNTILCKVERQRYIQNKGVNEPIAIQTSYIPNDLISVQDLKLLEREDSLYSVLYKTRELKPYRANESYSIHLINQKDLAKLLDQKSGDPAFFVKRLTFNGDGIPFEYAESILRWNRYTLDVELYEEKHRD